MVLPEALLDRAELAVASQALDRRNLGALGLHREQEARAHCLAIEQNGARAAYAVLAADVGAGEREILAEVIAEQLPRLDRAVIEDAIDRDGQVLFARHLLTLPSIRERAARLRPAPV